MTKNLNHPRSQNICLSFPELQSESQIILHFVLIFEDHNVRRYVYITYLGRKKRNHHKSMIEKEARKLERRNYWTPCVTKQIRFILIIIKIELVRSK